MCWVMPPASSGDDVGRADRVEQLGLAVVDVAHDGDDRRPRLQGVLVLVGDLGVEVDVERLEQLAVLVLGADDLDVVAELRSRAARTCPRRATGWPWPSRRA